MIAVAAVLIFTLIMWDLFKPAPRAAQPESEVVTTMVPEAAPPNPPISVSQGTTTPATSAPMTEPRGAVATGGREPSYIELLARSETRRRIRASGNSTYLGDMLTETSDSMLRRWDNRMSSPIRVWLAPTNAANFKPAFLDAIRTAFAQWTNVGVPVRFNFDSDSTAAEVAVRWRIQFEIERTGQTDVTWDEDGHIQSAVITLATFDPKGRPMEADDIRVVAIHEVGHLLGLDHSRDSTDIMFPTAKVRELSERDVRTAVLLYQLSPGSLR
jgi:predicted Zn-dependent protease